MSDWFSNRGQIIQVIAAVMTGVVGIFVATIQNYIPVFLAIALVVLAFALFWILVRRLASPGPAAALSLAPLFANEKFTANWSYETIRLKTGERWKDERNEVKLIGVKQLKRGHAAIVSVTADLNYFCAGVEVERNGSYFILPEATFHDQNCIVVSYTVAKTFVQCFSVRAEHVNPVAGEVELVITRIDGQHL